MIAWARWLGAAAFATLDWTLTRDGATYAELWWLTLVAVFLLSYVVLIDWIADARETPPVAPAASGHPPHTPPAKTPKSTRPMTPSREDA